ncbi:MAG TPA: hypothetical protein PK364_12455, partial [Synergistaceae bacterium]|nr:hypothetical protein [Synergistaceae bacterium]
MIREIKGFFRVLMAGTLILGSMIFLAEASSGASQIVLATGEVLWRSAPLVSNCSNFARSGDGIITGYGFTEEDDYLYVDQALARMVRFA